MTESRQILFALLAEERYHYLATLINICRLCRTQKTSLLNKIGIASSSSFLVSELGTGLFV
jgi:hypothetical protein